MSELALLPERYRLMLCDIWGCVHDGVRIFPKAAALLELWRSQGRIVLLVTNAPRPAGDVQALLDRLGLSRSCYDAVISSGDTGIAALLGEGVSEVGFIGRADDRTALAGSGLKVLPGPDGPDVVCTGLRDRDGDPADEDEVLRAMLARRARLHCFNPDRVVLHGEAMESCAGAIAERYEAMGGTTAWYGKPYQPIYERCLAMASNITGRAIPATSVVAIGDSLATDFVGAARAGFDFVFVTHGIEGQEVESVGAGTLIERFAAERGVDLPEPIAVVSELA